MNKKISDIEILKLANMCTLRSYGLDEEFLCENCALHELGKDRKDGCCGVLIEAANRYAQKEKTNKYWLTTLSPEQWFDYIGWLYHDYGKRFTDTRLEILEWLEREHTESDEPEWMKNVNFKPEYDIRRTWRRLSQ